MFINGETQMFKQIITLVRGTSHEATEAALAPHTHTILRQQIRDCAQALVAARNAVAIAKAQAKQEEQQAERITTSIADLEIRTLAAMEHGHNDLAQEAAQSIALLEDERATSRKAGEAYQAEIIRLTSIIRQAEFKLKELERGQKLTDATAKAQKLRGHGGTATLSTFKDAEATLARLRERQQHVDLTMEALDEMDLSRDPSSITEKLAAAGCGPALKTRADDVLKRLSERSTKPAA
jgi:phage shock protein A